MSVAPSPSASSTVAGAAADSLPTIALRPIDAPERASSPWNLRNIARLFAVALLLGSPWLLLRVPSVQVHLGLTIESLRTSGVAGMALFIAIYCVGVTLLVPVALLSGLSGYAFGPGLGLALAVPACVVGTAVAFSLGRLFGRRAIRARLEGDVRFCRIESVIGDRGFRIALLLRLSPFVPQSPLGYALSATRLPLPTFMAATLLGLFPITVLHVWFGSLVGNSAALLRGDAGPRGTQAIALTVAAVAVTLAGVVLMARMARRNLLQITSAVPPVAVDL